MNSRKREKPYFSRHAPYSLPKRRRQSPIDAHVPNSSKLTSTAPTSVLVIGVPPECSVLDLKSRFEMYGPISRTRMEPHGVAYINFRSNEAAKSAVDAAQDSTFPITLHSSPVQVMWASDPLPQREGGVGKKEGLWSKLVRAEVPLSRYGRANKLGSAIVNPRQGDEDNGDTNNDDKLDSSGIERPFRGREIVAYDDIL